MAMQRRTRECNYRVMPLMTRDELRQIPSLHDGRNHRRHHHHHDVDAGTLTTTHDGVVPTLTAGDESHADVIGYQRDAPYRVEYDELRVSQVSALKGLPYIVRV